MILNVNDVTINSMYPDKELYINEHCPRVRTLFSITRGTKIYFITWKIILKLDIKIYQLF